MNDKQPKAMKRTMTAPCDIFEENGKIVMRLDMPGVDKNGLSVHVENDELQITGRRNGMDPSGARWLVREIPDRDYYQAYTLDSTIDRNKIEAELVKGQLVVTLSVKESEKPRKIEVLTKD